MMFYAEKVQDTRQLFFSSWDKYQQQQQLSPLEQQIVEVIRVHPEYHGMLEISGDPLDQVYFPELGQNNPFLHMGFHLAIRDQVAIDRPLGIKEIYQRLMEKHGNALTVEHVLMDHLAACLWQAQRNQQMPDETAYLQACLALI